MPDALLLAVLGGTLLRHGHNDWRWSDGTPDPRVFDDPDNPAGAEWRGKLEDEFAILDRAFSLGWRPEPDYVSPAGWRAPQIV